MEGKHRASLRTVYNMHMYEGHVVFQWEPVKAARGEPHTNLAMCGSLRKYIFYTKTLKITKIYLSRIENRKI